jgi:hypothetical protein
MSEERATGGGRDLLDVLRHCEGMAMLSGYPNPLYDMPQAGWTRIASDGPIVDTRLIILLELYDGQLAEGGKDRLTVDLHAPPDARGTELDCEGDDR